MLLDDDLGLVSCGRCGVLSDDVVVGFWPRLVVLCAGCVLDVSSQFVVGPCGPRSRDRQVS